MELIELLRLGTPVLVLGMLVLLERINTKVCAISEDISELKRCIIRQDTCNARHEEINRRFIRIECETAGEGG
jgi:hypothetical protein